MTQRRFDDGLLVAAVVVLLVAMGLALGNVMAGQGALERHLIDSYYYFDAAANVARRGVPAIDWPQGPSNKYFPGYGVALGVWSALTGADPWVAWRGLQVALFVAIAPAAVGVFRRMGFAPWVAVLTGALLATNPVLQRWSGVPFSEPLCLLLLLMQVMVASTPQWRGRRVADSWPGVVAMGLLGGAAAATRVEALVLQAPLFAVAWRVGGVRAWGRLSLAAALVVMPLGAWLAAFSGGRAPHYLNEGGAYFVFAEYFNSFWNMLANTVRYFQLQAGAMWLHVGYWATWHTFLVALFIAVRGVLGPGPRAWAGVLLGYFLLHAFWYYSSDRYVIVVLPLVYGTLAVGVHWLFEQTPHATPLASRGNALLMAALLSYQAIAQGGSRFVLDDHVASINTSRSDADHQQIAAALPADATVLTDMGPELALWHTGTTWFVSPDALNYTGLEADGAAAYARAMPPAATVRLALSHPLDAYPLLARLARARGATMESEPMADVRIWVVPHAVVSRGQDFPVTPASGR